MKRKKSEIETDHDRWPEDGVRVNTPTDGTPPDG
jgi:hypothetical protein